MGPIHSLSDEDWNKTFSVNTTGVFNMSRAVSKNMMLRKSGAIVTVGSNAANTPRMEMVAYLCVKGHNDDVYEMFRTRACGIQYTAQLSFSRFY